MVIKSVLWVPVLKEYDPIMYVKVRSRFILGKTGEDVHVCFIWRFSFYGPRKRKDQLCNA